MFKRGLLAGGMVLALAAPAFAQVQITPGPPPPPPPVTTVTIPSATIIFAPSAPPPLRVETPPPPPQADLFWKPGHWAWNVNQAKYDWVDGAYIARPTAVASYKPGYWEQRPDGWAWIDGHWN